MGNSGSHGWRFFRAGGFDQARVESAGDFGNLENLDQKLWAALACPVKGLEFDERTLALIDGDGDSRVRAPEVMKAAQWCEDHFADLSKLGEGTDVVPLSRIKTSTDGGAAVMTGARQMLAGLGKADADSISLADVSDTAALFAQTKFNGDGVVTPASADDESVSALIADIVTCSGGTADRSGADGVNQDQVDAFFDECTTLTDWAALSASDEAILALGDGTAAAADAWRAARAKVDDFFGRCKLVAYDERALAAANRGADPYASLAEGELSISVSEIADQPVARIEAGRSLPLAAGVNPAWAGAIAALRTAAIVPTLGERHTITEAEWAELGGKLAAYEAWSGAKPATSVEQLGMDRVKEIVGGDGKAAIDALIGQDKELEDEYNAITEVERLVRYHRDLYQLMRNFVNLGDFYDPSKLATFQAGTLYLDGRACTLCVKVLDAGKHGALAGMAKAYLAYVKCTRPSGETMNIAAAFTDGDSDYLMVGRNGIFYDRDGQDWDATITKIIANPISIREAFWSPYKKFVRAMEEMAAKRAAAKEAESNKRMAAAGAKAGSGSAEPPKKMDVGTVAALGVAVGAIGAFLTALVGYATNAFSLPFWMICLILVAILLMISGPGMIMAWLKLRQRNLAPILDANGWAVNGRAKMTVSFGKSLTSVAELPEGAVSGADPHGDKPSAWPGLIKLVVVVAFLFSLVNYYGAIHMALSAAGVEDIPSFISDGTREEAKEPETKK